MDTNLQKCSFLDLFPSLCACSLVLVQPLAIDDSLLRCEISELLITVRSSTGAKWGFLVLVQPQTGKGFRITYILSTLGVLRPFSVDPKNIEGDDERGNVIIVTDVKKVQ